MNPEQNNTPKGKRLGLVFLLVWGIPMGGTIIGATASSGPAAEFVITRGIMYAVLAGIVVGIMAALPARK